MAWVKSIGGVLAGFLVAVLTVMALTAVAVLLFFGGDFSAEPTAAYLALNLAYSAGAAALGGWLAGVVAGRAPFAHAGALALLLLAVSVFGGAGGQEAPGVPGWYGPALTVLGPLGALAGGAIRRVLTNRR